MSAEFGGRQTALQAGSAPLIRNVFHDALRFSIAGDNDSEVAPARIPLAEMVQTKVRHNAVEPGKKRALKADSGEIQISPQKSFLVNVLCVFDRTSQMHRQPQHRAII